MLKTINPTVGVEHFIVEWYLMVSVKHVMGLVFNTLLSGLVLNMLTPNYIPTGKLNMGLYLVPICQRFSNCGPRATSGPRVLPLWSF